MKIVNRHQWPAQVFYPLLAVAFALKHFELTNSMGASLLVGGATLALWLNKEENARQIIIWSSHAVGVLYFLVDRWWPAAAMAVLGIVVSLLRVPQLKRPLPPCPRGLVVVVPALVALASHW